MVYVTVTMAKTYKSMPEIITESGNHYISDKTTRQNARHAIRVRMESGCHDIVDRINQQSARLAKCVRMESNTAMLLPF